MRSPFITLKPRRGGHLFAVPYALHRHPPCSSAWHVGKEATDHLSVAVAGITASAVGHVRVRACLIDERIDRLRPRVVETQKRHQSRGDLLARKTEHLAGVIQVLREHADY